MACAAFPNRNSSPNVLQAAQRNRKIFWRNTQDPSCIKSKMLFTFYKIWQKSDFPRITGLESRWKRIVSGLWLHHYKSWRPLFVLADYLYDLILFMGPCFILQCYTYRNSLQTIRNYCRVPVKGFIIRPLADILSERREPEFIESPYGLLDSIYGVDDKCTSISLENDVQTECRHICMFRRSMRHRHSGGCWRESGEQHM